MTGIQLPFSIMSVNCDNYMVRMNWAIITPILANPRMGIFSWAN
jgi:hypothetical protein